ncbi:COPRS protein, partial [Upupa epops]|nr:COPRS protein [Upupa epops]
VPDAVTFPELQTAPVYEAEDWDKELEEADCNPYDAEDFYCGNFQKNNLLASCVWQEDSFYNPSCHHAACLVFTPPIKITETGQFDDADE